MSALLNLLGTFRATAHTEREKGTYFERLVKTYLTNEPYYRDEYKHVWLWEEWRKEAAKRGLGDVRSDAGIDLVAETATGELHAIQAKFYDEDARLTLRDLSTFLTAAGRKEFSHGLIFLTATKSTEHLREAIKNQKTPVSLVTLHDLEASQIDWSKYQPGAKPVLKPQKHLRPHQQHALAAVKEGLAKADRGKLIMACGTGKTFVALKIAEELAGKGGRVLFLMPSLALLSQALTEWTQESGTVTGPEGKVLSVTPKGIAPGKLADEAATFRVEKMKVPKSGKDKDLTRLIYNAHITVIGIPPEAYDYVVNGKPALDWVIERQRVKTDKASGIVNDANDWAIETMHNPRYPLELFLRVITVSLETMKIVRSLPRLDIFEGAGAKVRVGSEA